MNQITPATCKVVLSNFTDSSSCVGSITLPLPILSLIECVRVFALMHPQTHNVYIHTQVIFQKSMQCNFLDNANYIVINWPKLILFPIQKTAYQVSINFVCNLLHSDIVKEPLSDSKLCLWSRKAKSSNVFCVISKNKQYYRCVLIEAKFVLQFQVKWANI